MKNKTDGTRGAAESLMFLPHLNVFCDLYLYTFGNVESFVSYENKAKCVTTSQTLADKLAYSPYQFVR